MKTRNPKILCYPILILIHQPFFRNLLFIAERPSTYLAYRRNESKYVDKTPKFQHKIHLILQKEYIIFGGYSFTLETLIRRAYSKDQDIILKIFQSLKPHHYIEEILHVSNYTLIDVIGTRIAKSTVPYPN